MTSILMWSYSADECRDRPFAASAADLATVSNAREKGPSPCLGLAAASGAAGFKWPSSRGGRLVVATSACP